MKILVTGGAGLVGSHFVENSPKVLSPTRKELDVTNITSVENFFKLNNPDIIVNFAAYTNVSKAERESNNKNAPCWIINVAGTANLIRVAKKSSYFIHISTDNVFSGEKNDPGPYDENHPTEKNLNLVSWYGWTKKEAEDLIKNNLANFAIVRISNPVRAKYSLKLDYTRKILSLFDQSKLYPMFDDQYLSLTYIDEVTKVLKVLIDQKLTGIFHISSVNLFTPHKLANFLVEKARGVKNAVNPVSIEEFLNKNPSRYPQYGGLKVKKTQQKLNLKFNTWEEIIIDLVKQWSI